MLQAATIHRQSAGERRSSAMDELGLVLRLLGFGALGFKGSGFQVLGFRVSGSGPGHKEPWVLSVMQAVRVSMPGKP